MPDNGAGIYSLPAIYTATPDTTIEAEQHNQPLEDIEAAITARLPRSGAAAMLGALTLAGDPTLDLHAATKSYVDDIADDLQAMIPGAATITWTDVASSATTDLGAQASDRIRITGATAITSFGTIGNGVSKKLRFGGSLVLTHNATSLILPGGANITTAAGDTAEVISLGGGNWVVFNYQKISGLAVVAPSISGRVGQVQFTMPGGVATGTTVMVADDSKPQSNEGIQVMTLAITPASASSTLEIEVLVLMDHTSAGSQLIAALFKDSDADALTVMAHQGPNTSFLSLKLKYVMAAGTTSAITFKVRIGSDTAGTVTFNGLSGTRRFGGVAGSSITIREILP